MLILAYDTETTGFPVWKEPSGSPKQPHLVEIGALLIDTETLEVLDHLDTLIRPEGWGWTPDAEACRVHGITYDKAKAEGIGEGEALAQFMALHERADLRVGHNESFDARIMRIAIKRYGDGTQADAAQDVRDQVAEAFKTAPAFDTCAEAKPIIKLPPTPKMLASRRFRNGYKPPNLNETHTYFFHRPHEGAHRAMADAEACARIYLCMQGADQAIPSRLYPPQVLGGVEVPTHDPIEACHNPPEPAPGAVVYGQSPIKTDPDQDTNHD